MLITVDESFKKMQCDVRIFTNIYHQNDPVMSVNIPAPWSISDRNLGINLGLEIRRVLEHVNSLIDSDFML